MAEKKSEETRVTRWDPFSDFDALARWSPFRELGAFPSRLSRLFDEVLGERALRALSPAIDVRESDTEYVVTAELPGVRREDVNVDLQEGVLSIHGEKRREETEAKGRWIERSYGSFHRSFSLPSDAASDRIDAKFKDGVLTITIPRAEQKKPQVIAVKE
ncbi:MAG: Hsp20/alpha crystallin family protein [Deltaproteobacteria bacterium]|nr:MAG: Hsp20/alpha crystallin family protein [Deltaproteobacteria bacterium]